MVVEKTTQCIDLHQVCVLCWFFLLCLIMHSTNIKCVYGVYSESQRNLK
jgi:hypothetical protein